MSNPIHHTHFPIYVIWSNHLCNSQYFQDFNDMGLAIDFARRKFRETGVRNVGITRLEKIVKEPDPLPRPEFCLHDVEYSSYPVMGPGCGIKG